ncbi:hypothetical protein [Photobacterium galatheae]|uniref:SIR2-like domain-containing protein n=1 Tax=Photobacterium galatheae TaxID=1654360 RepID=A0A066RKA2_9GAMM|nr:hypothetical protein [Photobacterium galatheae]KDM90875.1 hypothetical protein EA58_14035 [Photobacterium galatheae]MCM0149157.1 hypothetical protein [Photobacterium galatheae]
MLSETEVNDLRKHLNRSASTIFVIGQGIDFKPELSWHNQVVRDLYSDDEGVVEQSWKALLSMTPQAQKIPFIGSYTQYVSQTALIDVANFYILNTSISGEIGVTSKNTVVVNLNGLLHKGVCKATGVIKDISTPEDTKDLTPAFIPLSENYQPFYDVVHDLEKFVEKQEVRSVFFIGVSGKCPVVESIFNRALMRSTMKDPVFKCVVNTEATYMDDEADLVVRADAKDFLRLLSQSFPDGERYFND